MQAHAIPVPALPDGLAMLIDDVPGSVVIWYLHTLTPDEVAQMLADVWATNANHGTWRRSRDLVHA